MSRISQSLAVCLTLALAVPARAGSGSFFIVVASADSQRVSVELRQPADFVAAEVALRSDKSDAAERFAQIGAAKAELAAQIAKHPGWLLYDGPVHLSGSGGGKLSSFAGGSAADATLLVPLGDDTNVFAASAALMRAVAEYGKAAAVDVTVPRVELAVRDPQQHRAQLLKLIADDAVRTRDGIAPGSQTRIEGLQGPVLVRQLDDRDVELYIDYKLAVEKR